MKKALNGFIEVYGIEAAMERVSSPTCRQIDLDFTELARG